MPTRKGFHFEVSERKLLLRLFDVIVVFCGLYIVGSLFSFDYFTITQANWTWSLVLALYILVFGAVFELYDLKQASKIDSSFKNIVLTASITVLVYLLTPYYTPFLPEKRVQIIYFYLTIIVALFLWRLMYVTFIESPRFYKRGLIIGNLDNALKIHEVLQQYDQNFKIVGFIHNDFETSTKVSDVFDYYTINDVDTVIKDEGVSEIVIAIDNPEAITPEIYQQLTSLLERGYKIREYSQLIESLTKRVPVEFVGKDFYKYFPFSRRHQDKLYLFFHRLFDILFSILGLLTLLLFIPFVFVGNLIGNRGSLFYIQERTGKNGKSFNIVKFRTMVKNAEKDGVQWASKNDSRVTKFGRILRNLRLDEMPQFFNVLKGEMSMIGPRPERPYFVKELSKVIPFYETRHAVKPGLTGWAQVNHRYGDTIDHSLLKLQYDLYYIKHRNFFLDIIIVVKTISTVLYYRGQ